jgi:hypothetical protein
MHTFTIHCPITLMEGWLESWGFLVSSEPAIALNGQQVAEI